MIHHKSAYSIALLCNMHNLCKTPKLIHALLMDCTYMSNVRQSILGCKSMRKESAVCTHNCVLNSIKHCRPCYHHLLVNILSINWVGIVNLIRHINIVYNITFTLWFSDPLLKPLITVNHYHGFSSSCYYHDPILYE